VSSREYSFGEVKIEFRAMQDLVSPCPTVALGHALGLSALLKQMRNNPHWNAVQFQIPSKTAVVNPGVPGAQPLKRESGQPSPLRRDSYGTGHVRILATIE
jgi:hypothetical protein